MSVAEMIDKPSPETAPERIAVSPDRAMLTMTFGGSVTRSLDAATLRTACRCAHCTRARIDGKFPQSFAAITIETVAPMGHYGINIGFSDGHARGIYPWGYLAQLLDN